MRFVKVLIKESTIVRPAEETPKRSLWMSNLDLVMPREHATVIAFFRPSNKHGSSSNFFDASVLKAALSKALVPFYPMAGRLKRNDEDGRIEIDCNGAGVLFVEAETESVIDDFGDFAPTSEVEELTPAVDDYAEFTSSPLLLVQVTRFKCGGVSVGYAGQHNVMDGIAAFHFFKTWAELARGVDTNLSPFLDRTLLRARNPPTPAFHHIEYQPLPCMETTSPSSSHLNTTTAVYMFKISRDQLNLLISRVKEQADKATVYSSNTILSAHVWRSTCMAYNLPDDHKTRLCIATNGRPRLRPPLPPGYFGNVVFTAVPTATSCELISKPLTYAVGVVHDALKRMNDDYLRSALDYMELQSDLAGLLGGPDPSTCLTMPITNWCQLNIYDMDFGWGRPVFVGPGEIHFEGMAYILPSPTNDGSVSVAISLRTEHVKAFEKFLYDFLRREKDGPNNWVLGARARL